VTTEPTIALLDFHLPDGDGIKLGTTLKHRWPHLRVLVFTMHA
jgi:DNA-binding NarL/FixJ family response regulator